MNGAQITALSLLAIGAAGVFFIVLGISAVSLLLALLAGFAKEENHDE